MIITIDIHTVTQFDPRVLSNLGSSDPSYRLGYKRM
ncbi:hypothetical protein SCG7086_AA_00500 [Chlamydiales bacterium SCGC AG-110-P3]|nr:hypothetical protein SCG7086_AA_00500 [Chlamydiales bacterium SCGC AG-110-P3]